MIGNTTKSKFGGWDDASKHDSHNGLTLSVHGMVGQCEQKEQDLLHFHKGEQNFNTQVCQDVLSVCGIRGRKKKYHTELHCLGMVGQGTDSYVIPPMGGNAHLFVFESLSHRPEYFAADDIVGGSPQTYEQGRDVARLQQDFDSSHRRQKTRVYTAMVASYRHNSRCFGHRLVVYDYPV